LVVRCPYSLPVPGYFNGRSKTLLRFKRRPPDEPSRAHSDRRRWSRLASGCRAELVSVAWIPLSVEARDLRVSIKRRSAIRLSDAEFAAARATVGRLAPAAPARGRLSLVYATISPAPYFALRSEAAISSPGVVLQDGRLLGGPGGGESHSWPTVAGAGPDRYTDPFLFVGGESVGFGETHPSSGPE
jgi:transposase InsO family protein